MTGPVGPQGWYPDPSGSGGRRYWDGGSWSAYAPPRFGAAQIAWWQRQSTEHKALLVVGAVVVAGLLLFGAVTCANQMSVRSECERQASQEGYRGSDKDHAVELCVDYEKRFGSAVTGALLPPVPPGVLA
ncbi:DUF2510 domain-containing protein [Mycobacterium sp. 2YAF39]|uniref:DUF2510 domain-containing protein n=1 Tax=Mycobacterium sp. 2YAF39 TaxID=3233033 RepID=UPI003F9ABFEB